MGLCSNGAVLLLASATVGAIAAGVWAPGLGPELPLAASFGWHPVLMALAFPGCMTLGSWAHRAAEPGAAARRAHGALMGAACASALLGCLAVLVPHLPRGQLLGYDFKIGFWKEWRRVLHACLGHLLVAAALPQAFVGLAKLRALGHGQRTLRFHGRVGRVILGLGAANAALGVWLSPWNPELKLVAAPLALLCALVATSCGGAAAPWQALPGGSAREGVELPDKAAGPPAAEALGRPQE